MRGDFVYSPLEMAVMRHDIEVAKTLGAAGVVMGVLRADGTIDREQMAVLDCAGPAAFADFPQGI